MTSDKKYIVMDCGSHLCGRCKVSRCEGQYLVPISPEERAMIKVAPLSLGTQTATCGHKTEVMGVMK